MVVRGDDARRLGLRTISDLRRFRYGGRVRLGVGYEFEERPDGLPGLEAAYGLHFEGSPRAMELGLLYRALGVGIRWTWWRGTRRMDRSGRWGW